MFRVRGPLAVVSILFVAGVAPKAFAQTVSEEEAQWRKTNEEVANGRGDESRKYVHRDVIEGCGHDVQVVFDWKSFTMSDWVGRFENGGQKPDPESFCAGDSEMLKVLSYMCKTHPVLKTIKTVTCHSKPCADLQRSSKNAADVSAGIERRWLNHGDNLDTTFCNRSTVFGGDPQSEAAAWLEQALTEPAAGKAAKPAEKAQPHAPATKKR